MDNTKKLLENLIQQAENEDVFTIAHRFYYQKQQEQLKQQQQQPQLEEQKRLLPNNDDELVHSALNSLRRGKDVSSTTTTTTTTSSSSSSSSSISSSSNSDHDQVTTSSKSNSRSLIQSISEQAFLNIPYSKLPTSYPSMQTIYHGNVNLADLYQQQQQFLSSPSSIFFKSIIPAQRINFRTTPSDVLTSYLNAASPYQQQLISSQTSLLPQANFNQQQQLSFSHLNPSTYPNTAGGVMLNTSTSPSIISRNGSVQVRTSKSVSSIKRVSGKKPYSSKKSSSSAKRAKHSPNPSFADRDGSDSTISTNLYTSTSEGPAEEEDEEKEEEEDTEAALLYKGVTHHPQSCRYRARIKIQNKTTHLGYFSTAYDAALAYDRAAYELRGERALMNFPEIVSNYQKPPQVGSPRTRGIRAAKEISTSTMLSTDVILQTENP